MLRTIILVRHGDAQRQTATLADFDRGLTKKGIAQIESDGAYLQSIGYKPDMVISSHAIRAKETATILSQILDYDPENMMIHKALYNGNPNVYEELIYALPESIHNIIIVAHNPGITFFANEAVASFSEIVMPKGAMFGFNIEAQDWTQFPQSEKKKYFYKLP